jgi:uncharacterized delta-60 repeat protein
MRVYLIAAALLLAADDGFSQAGSLDLSFNGTGSVLMPVGPPTYYNYPGAVTIQPTDQKILVAGEALTANGNTAFTVLRYLPDGSLDASFGTGGIAMIDPGVSNSGASGMAVQPDGKIVLVGGSLVMRLTSSGVLDAGFDQGGMATIAGLDAGKVALQNNGDILVGGVHKKKIGVVRFHSNGTQDMAYGGDGFATYGTGGGDQFGSYLTGMAIQSNGRLVVAGVYEPGAYEMMVGRFTTSGAADASFGSGGRAFVTVGNDDALESGDVAIQSDGKIVVEGSYMRASGDMLMLLIRLDTDGTLDNSFAGNGKKGIVLGDLCYPAGVALQANGKIVAAGAAGPESGPLSFVVVRLDASDGSLDQTFGSGGEVNTVFGSGTSVPAAVAIQANGRIVVAGSTEYVSGTNEYNEYVTVRYLASGSNATNGTGGVADAVAGNGVIADASSAMNIFPNPTQSVLRIQGLAPGVSTLLTVRDAAGKNVLMARSAGQAQYSLNVQGLAPGVYFLEVLGGTQKRSFGFVKVR